MAFKTYIATESGLNIMKNVYQVRKTALTDAAITCNMQVHRGTSYTHAYARHA